MSKQKQGDNGEQEMRLLELCQVITDAEAAGLVEIAARWMDVATGEAEVTPEVVAQAEQELAAARTAA
ncbi:MAG: hypothetical protein ACO24O_10000 [Arenimonas sp.]